MSDGTPDAAKASSEAVAATSPKKDPGLILTEEQSIELETAFKVTTTRMYSTMVC
jgi:hypothetical protein